MRKSCGHHCPWIEYIQSVLKCNAGAQVALPGPHTAMTARLASFQGTPPGPRDPDCQAYRKSVRQANELRVLQLKVSTSP